MDKIINLSKAHSSKSKMHSFKNPVMHADKSALLPFKASDWLSDMEQEEFDDVDDVNNIFQLLETEKFDYDYAAA